MRTLHRKNDHHWAVILAGGEGERIQEFVRLRYGSRRPKQYCTFVGTRSMFRHTVDRAEHLVPTERLLIAIGREHYQYLREELDRVLPGNAIIQPKNCETGPAILYALLHLLQRDKDAVVTLFPSDHFILREDRFIQYVRAASSFANLYPELLILLGVEPNRPEVDYGWIEMRERVAWSYGKALHRVGRFWEKPSVKEAKTLYERRCLWNTLVLVSRAETLVRQFQTLMPEAYQPLHEIVHLFGTAREEEAAKEVFAALPTINFSSAILERIPLYLGVVPMRGVYWSDWGDQKRIERDIAEFGLVAREYAK